jgi:Ribonuclease G/E
MHELQSSVVASTKKSKNKSLKTRPPILFPSNACVYPKNKNAIGGDSNDESNESIGNGLQNIANGISQPLQFLIVRTMHSRVHHQMLGMIHPGKEL